MGAGGHGYQAAVVKEELKEKKRYIRNYKYCRVRKFVGNLEDKIEAFFSS